MANININRSHETLVLIVDDVLDNLAVLHDSLAESGFAVLVANSGKAALHTAKETQPDIILLDAIMPEMDGFEVCRQLKADTDTQHIPVIFMTGLTEAEHVVAGFAAGGCDYVTKPIRPTEVLARMAAHLQTSREMNQTRGALDAFGQAAIAVTPRSSKIVWQTPLARQWIEAYSANTQLQSWVNRLFEAADKTAAMPLTVLKGDGRLIFTLVEMQNDEQWVILLREESDVAQIEALITTFKLTRREAEVLYWAIKGKTNRDIGDILGTSPRTVNKHLEHVFAKLGVETRTAASALARSKIVNIKI